MAMAAHGPRPRRGSPARARRRLDRLRHGLSRGATACRPSSIGRRPDVRCRASGAEVADALDGKLPDNDEIFAACHSRQECRAGLWHPSRRERRSAAPQSRPCLHGARSRPGHRRLRRGDRQHRGFAKCNAAGLGAISISPQDNQGIVRQVPLIWSDGQACLPEPGPGGSAGGAGRPDDPGPLHPGRTRGRACPSASASSRSRRRGAASSGSISARRCRSDTSRSRGLLQDPPGREPAPARRGQYHLHRHVGGGAARRPHDTAGATRCRACPSMPRHWSRC